MASSQDTNIHGFEGVRGRRDGAFHYAAAAFSPVSSGIIRVPFKSWLLPMSIFAIGIEHPLGMTVQRLHDPDPRHHRRPAAGWYHLTIAARHPRGRCH